MITLTEESKEILPEQYKEQLRAYIQWKSNLLYIDLDLRSEILQILMNMLINPETSLLYTKHRVLSISNIAKCIVNGNVEALGRYLSI